MAQRSDHLMLMDMNRKFNWLTDNINDLHRELKQTENDLEHYIQVIGRIFIMIQ